MSIKDCSILLTIFVVLFSSIGISNAYAEELTYDEKLEFAFKIKQITSHMISALADIKSEEFQLAKMHLIHPIAEHSDIVDFLQEDSICSKKLELALTMLQHTRPEADRDEIYKRFSHLFKILNNCMDLVVGIDMHPHFYNNLVDKMLEKSIEEYEASAHTTGMGKKMKYQDALGLVIRADMLVETKDIHNVKGVHDNHITFNELFDAYQNKASVSEVIRLTNELREHLMISESVEFQDSSEQHELIVPTIYLKSERYSEDLKVLTLHGKNFESQEKVIVEYFDEKQGKSIIFNGFVTSDGIFSIPFEIVEKSFEELMMFTVTVDDTVLYQILSISEDI